MPNLQPTGFLRWLVACLLVLAEAVPGGHAEAGRALPFEAPICGVSTGPGAPDPGQAPDRHAHDCLACCLPRAAIGPALLPAVPAVANQAVRAAVAPAPTPGGAAPSFPSLRHRARAPPAA